MTIFLDEAFSTLSIFYEPIVYQSREAKSSFIAKSSWF